MGRPAIVTHQMEDFIRARLEQNPSMPAKTIYSLLLEYLKTKKINEIPSEAVITKRITANRGIFKEIQKPQIDSPWSLVSVNRYPISRGTINHLLNYKQLDKTGLVTIRLAQWLDKIWPLVEKIALKRRDDEVINWVFPISMFYSRMERYSDIFKNGYYDSTELDNYFFISEEFFNISDTEKLKFLEENISRDIFPNGFLKRTVKHERTSNLSAKRTR